MYETEFAAIWSKQQTYHPALLTDSLLYGSQGKQLYPIEPKSRGKQPLMSLFGIHGLLFFQRKMYWPSSSVGKCELEPKLPRCPKADRAAQRFRMLQEVNNLRVLDSDTLMERSLTGDERQRLLAFLERHKVIKFDEIPKKLGLLESVRFNLQRGERKSLKGMETDCLLAGPKLFGKKWFERRDNERDAIVRTLLDESLEDDGIRALAIREWGVAEEVGDQLIKVNFPDDHARYSLVAIKKLLPALERGLPLNSATGEPCALREAGYLNPHEKVLGQRDLLPEPPAITNPLVRQAMFEVRKVVNALLREFGKPDHIHIEMAREIKGNAEMRSQMGKDMRGREARRDFAADEIRAGGFKPTGPAITRLLLWLEQDKICAYSGKPISLKQLLEGEVDEDHILPYSRSLDDSQMNRVICFRDENRLKGDRTPHEWLAAADPDKYEKILQRITKLPYPKAKRFRQESVELTEFFARQFVDTAYIATQAREYVGCLGRDVVCTKGQHTAELRRRWGLNTVLRDDGLDLKNREDHRHHAVDAVVIALTDRKRLHELSRIAKTKHMGRAQEQLEEPWEGFRRAIEEHINSINVSHRPLRKIRGALHEETVYSPTQQLQKARAGERPWAKNWIEEEGCFAYRKPLTSLTLAEVENIRDEQVKALVKSRLEKFGVKVGRKKKGAEDSGAAGAIPKEAWKEPLYLSGSSRSSGSLAVVKKVRIVKKENTIRQLGEHGVRHVKPGSLHHLCLFEFVNNKGKNVREAVFVDMIEASRRVRRKEAIIQRVHPSRPDARFLFSLSRGEMVQGTFKGKQRLVFFSTAASTQGQIYFVDHTDARPSSSVQKYAVKANTLEARKVAVDPLGRLRWAND